MQGRAAKPVRGVSDSEGSARRKRWPFGRGAATRVGRETATRVRHETATPVGREAATPVVGQVTEAQVIAQLQVMAQAQARARDLARAQAQASSAGTSRRDKLM